MNKAKATGVNASSFFDLKAELSKQEHEFAKNKAAGKSATTVGGVKRPDKKPTVWGRQNKGVKSRAARDVELEAISKPTIDAARATLERKAKIYEKLRRGQTGGLNDKQYDALLVDFDQKAGDVYESDSDDVDESLEVPRAPAEEQDDPIVEYEDEFGRIRTARRSEVPRHLAPPTDDGLPEEDEDVVIYNPVNHFPTYEPSAERIAEIAAAHSEANNPLGVHYDASQEVRAKAAGFYQFSGDEETRRQQMDELMSARKETVNTRQETGAVDLTPGEIDGMQEEGGAAGVKSRAMEKRKRQLEERRRLVEAKRRKVQDGIDAPTVAPTETDSLKPQDHQTVAVQVVADPLVSPSGKKKRKGKAKITATENDADAFLAQLEQEILVGKKT